MADFMIRFCLCNVWICGIIGILLAARRIFRNSLSSRMQYNLWFLLLGLLAVPFLPLRLTGSAHIFSLLGSLRVFPSTSTSTDLTETTQTAAAGDTNWMNDFTLSVNSKTPPIAGYILLGIWSAGIFVMILFVIKSLLRLRTLEKSALPLQSLSVRRLYDRCRDEMGIIKDVPVYSTAFLKSPIIVGLVKPRIYLPIHLISDYSESDLRYMMLHELQHYKHKDALAGGLMNLAGIIYWFHPLVWYALKEMRNDREIACDTSVLKMLDEDAYKDYGSTLINFAEKVSLIPFPFTAGLNGNMNQIRRRITNIATYEKPGLWKCIKGMTAFMLTAALLSGLAPILSIYAADDSRSQGNSSSENTIHLDLSAYFGEYEGSFVLYDLQTDTYRIYNPDLAALRTAPNSTYKIYDALFGLEEGVITPEDSLIAWNGENYPFEAWNSDQTLSTAMASSVNWYFQSIDRRLGYDNIRRYIQQIGYGNKTISSDISAYWMDSSLKISPLEQVELLIKLHNNSFGFAPESINAVKDAMRLFTSVDGTFYGKTGTRSVDGQDVSGWFIGFVEAADHTYFFAAAIGADSGVSGRMAADITMSILSDMEIWK